MCGMCQFTSVNVVFQNCLDRSGKISYEQSGEMFFIPYSTLDLEDGSEQNEQIPELEDKVTFCIATDKKYILFTLCGCTAIICGWAKQLSLHGRWREICRCLVFENALVLEIVEICIFEIKFQ